MKGEMDAPPSHGFRVECALFANLKASPLELLAQACRFQLVNEKKILDGPSDPADAPDLVQADRVAIILNSASGRELGDRSPSEAGAIPATRHAGACNG